MDFESDSGDDSLTIQSDLNTEVLSKLRRLKIQESIISSALKKSDFDQIDHTVDSIHFFDWRGYSTKLKKSVTEIKNKLADIKLVTSDSTDNLINIDIEEVKKDVLNLDEKIKALGDFINSELLILKRNEEEILVQINEKPKIDVKLQGKVQTKHYTEIVPSPVRVLINCPLKCAEVQNFQEFMSKSKNRYGGWNEYNHNIFVQIWNKFYTANDITSLKKYMNEVIENVISPQFVTEVCEKIPGTKSDVILSHSKWYSEFCYLKTCQQIALEKWKDNRGKIKKRQNVKRNITSSLGNPRNDKLCRKPNGSNKYQKSCYERLPEEREYIQCQSSFNSHKITSEGSLHLIEEFSVITPEDSKSMNRRSVDPFQSKPVRKSPTFARPTKQWMKRCFSVQDTASTNHSNIESVDKLGIPNWRTYLK